MQDRGKKDIFDRLMGLPGLRIFEAFYKEKKEILLYLFFGGLTFLVSVVSYAYFNIYCHLNELVANIISWVLAVLFAFVTNRIWVFENTTDSVKAFIKQMLFFFGGRIATLVVEEIILLLFITILHFSSMPVKVMAQIIVIVLNYIISKRIVFK